MGICGDVVARDLARLFVLENLGGIENFARAYAQQINDEGAMRRAQEPA